MTWSNRRPIVVSFCIAVLSLSAANTSRADCSLTDWLFGRGRTTYSAPYTPPTVCAPPPQACGCCPAVSCAPACPTPAPATAYRISYRPVPTVAYMPVTSTDPCSGCAVTTYQPTRVWTYYGSLTPYQVGYAAPVCVGCSTCSSCGGVPACGSPPSGYSSCGCSSCGTPVSGCSSCGTGVISGYASSSGCSSCGVSGAILPGPAEMSQPPAAPMTVSPAAPATLGAPTPAPAAPAETGRTYPPGVVAPVAPGAPGTAGPNNSSSDNRRFRLPAASDADGAISPPRVENVPPVVTGPQLGPTPAPRPEGSDRVTAKPASHLNYFQLLTSPPKTVPAQTVSLPAPAASLPADDGGWVHVSP